MQQLVEEEGGEKIETVSTRKDTIDAFRTTFPTNDATSVDELFHSFLLFMKHKRGFDFSKLSKIYSERTSDITFPLDILATSLSPAEALCKYLKEQNKMSFRAIGKLLNRDERTIWSSYQRSKKKHSQSFFLSDTSISIPLNIFSNRALSTLEHVVLHLVQHEGLRISEVARKIQKHPSAMHTVYRRALKKQQASASVKTLMKKERGVIA